MSRAFRSGILLTAIAVCAGCAAADKVAAPPVPVPGNLSLSLTTPATDDGAILITVAGPIAAVTTVTGAPGLVVHSRVAGTTLRIAVFGSLATGQLLTFAVPDVNVVPSYTASLVQVADSTSALRAALTGYSLSISR